MTLGCSTCGYVVEFVRSCKKSKWRLHRDSPQLTDGRYWFAPTGTPAYPFAHNLGSREWVSDERDPLPELGEWEGPTQWDDGFPPRPIPLPVLVGNPDCIEFGDVPPDEPFVQEPAFTSQSYPQACWSADRPQVLAFDINECTTIVPFAQALALLYNSSANSNVFLASLLGPTYVVSDTPNPAGPVPGSVIAVGPRVIVIIAGTSNFQQFALQGLYLATGITDFGNFSTTHANMFAALSIEDRITAAGGVAQDEYWFIGHSFGGAIAEVLGARMRINRPDVRINVLTFGAPVAGDRRLADLLAGARQRHFCNDQDPVPGLPPRGFNLDELLSVLGVPLQSLWRRLHPPQNRALLFDDFTFKDSGAQFLDFAITKTVAAAIAAAVIPAPFDVHFMTEYLLRLTIVCDGPVDTNPHLTFRVIIDTLQWDDSGPFVGTFDVILTQSVFNPGSWTGSQLGGGIVTIDANSIFPTNWQFMNVAYFPQQVLPFTDHFFWQFGAAEMLDGFTTQLFPKVQFDSGVCFVTGLVRLQIIPIETP